jgi:hypothetical protein
MNGWDGSYLVLDLGWREGSTLNAGCGQPVGWLGGWVTGRHASSSLALTLADNRLLPLSLLPSHSLILPAHPSSPLLFHIHPSIIHHPSSIIHFTHCYYYATRSPEHRVA